MSPVATQQLLDSAYIIATVLFILSMKWLSSPTSARRGVLVGEIAAALAVGATLCNPELTEYKWIDHYADYRRGDRHSSRHGADDRGAPADGAEPRVWRAFRVDDRNCGILRGRSECAAIRDGRNRRWK